VRGWAFTIALLVAIAVFAASAMAFAERDSTAIARADNVKARSAASATAEALRIERRDSFRNTGCRHHGEAFASLP
jgi:hypothetical protein